MNAAKDWREMMRLNKHDQIALMCIRAAAVSSGVDAEVVDAFLFNLQNIGTMDLN